MPRKDERAGLGQETISGKVVSAYDPAVCLSILERIAEGETLSSICSETGMPHRRTFNRWVVIHPELSRAYTAARELSAQAFEEEALGLARILTGPNDFNGTKVRAYEVAMAQLRWSAARRDPSRYGQAANTVAIVPIQINTTLDMGGGAGGRSTPEHPDIYRLEAKQDPSLPSTPVFTDPMIPPDEVTHDVVEKENSGTKKRKKRRLKPPPPGTGLQPPHDDPDINP